MDVSYLFSRLFVSSVVTEFHEQRAPMEYSIIDLRFRAPIEVCLCCIRFQMTVVQLLVVCRRIYIFYVGYKEQHVS